MKKYILTTALIAISYFGFAQLSPSGQFRIADRGTAVININLPVGSQIYVASDSSLWDVRVGIDSASQLTINAAYSANKLNWVNRDNFIDNEGKLSVGDTLSGAGATINSNTSGSNKISILGGAGIHVTHSGERITISDTTSSTYKVEAFEEASGTATGHVLAHTPLSGKSGLTVQLNGMPLKQAEYGLSGSTVTVSIPVYQYDRVMISYTY